MSATTCCAKVGTVAASDAAECAAVCKAMHSGRSEAEKQHFANSKHLQNFRRPQGNRRIPHSPELDKLKFTLGRLVQSTRQVLAQITRFRTDELNGYKL